MLNPLLCGDDLKCLHKLYRISKDEKVKRKILEKMIQLEKKKGNRVPIYYQLYVLLYAHKPPTS